MPEALLPPPISQHGPDTPNVVSDVGPHSGMSRDATLHVQTVHGELQQVEQRLDMELELAVELAATVTGANPEDSHKPFALIAFLGLSVVGFWVIMLSWLYSATIGRLCSAVSSSQAVTQKAVYDPVLVEGQGRLHAGASAPTYHQEAYEDI